MWQYLQISEALLAVIQIDQNLPENRNKTSVLKDEVALCEESGSGVQREVNNRRLKGGEIKPSNSLESGWKQWPIMHLASSSLKRERKAKAMRESSNSWRGILKNDWNLSAMWKQVANLNKIWLAGFHSNRYIAIKEATYPNKAVYYLQFWFRTTFSLEWEGQLWQGFFKVLYSLSTHSPSFLLFMFGLKLASTLTLNNTNNYNRYLCLSSTYFCTLITKSFLCWPWRQGKIQYF